MVETKYVAAGLFSTIIGLILLFQAPEPLGKYYVSLPLILIGIILLVKGFIE